jgi:hypothetical protein
VPEALVVWTAYLARGLPGARRRHTTNPAGNRPVWSDIVRPNDAKYQKQETDTKPSSKHEGVQSGPWNRPRLDTANGCPAMRAFRLPPRSGQDRRSSGILRGVEWLSPCRRFGTTIGPIFMCQESNWALILEAGADCPETSVRNYHYTLRNIPEGCRSQLLSDSLDSPPL